MHLLLLSPFWRARMADMAAHPDALLCCAPLSSFCVHQSTLLSPLPRMLKPPGALPTGAAHEGGFPA